MTISGIWKTIFDSRYEIGIFFLFVLNLVLSYIEANLLNLQDVELAANSLAFIFLVLIVVGISRLIKAARTSSATTKIVFFTLLITLFVKVSTVMREQLDLSAISTEIDRQSLIVDETQAKSLALRIEEFVSNGEVKQAETLYDGDRFTKKILRGQTEISPTLRDIARGGGKSFKKGMLLEQMSDMVKGGGEFAFVKFYLKKQEPILQFRLLDASGNLHYLDAYIFRATDGGIGIDDLHYYNSGELLSRQFIENTTALTDRGLDNSSSSLESFQKAIQLARQGSIAEAYKVLESLPDNLKQQKMSMRLRIQLGYQVDVERAEALLSEFRNKYPDDVTIVFSAFMAAVAKDDLDSAASLIDDIYKVVEGDEYLLWYKANLLLMQKKDKEVIRLLSDMERDYNIDVVSGAENELPEEFLTSREYKNWKGQHKNVKKQSP